MGFSAQQLDVVSDGSPFGFVEHITLESPEQGESRYSGADPADNLVVSQTFDSRFHGQWTELCLPGRHALSVRTALRHGGHLEYSTDLSFARPKVVRVFTFPWERALAAVMFGLFAVAAFGSAMQTAAAVGPLLATGLVLLLIAALAAWGTLRGTTVSLELRSLHGDVALARVTAGPFRLNPGSPFFDELARRTEAAHSDDFRTQGQFLRDEMREHQRLFSLGVLTPQDYEAGKKRILAAH